VRNPLITNQAQSITFRAVAGNAKRLGRGAGGGMAEFDAHQTLRDPIPGQANPSARAGSIANCTRIPR
jgi:hypothetical protein